MCGSALPHNPVKPRKRLVSAQTSEPTDVSSRVPVSPLACKKIIHLSCGPKTSPLPHNVPGHSWHARAFLPLVSNNI